MFKKRRKCALRGTEYSGLRCYRPPDVVLSFLSGPVHPASRDTEVKGYSGGILIGAV